MKKNNSLKNALLCYFPLLAFVLLCVQHYFYLSADNSPIHSADCTILKPYMQNFLPDSKDFIVGSFPNLVSQVNNIFFNLLYFIRKVDFMTSYNWANVFIAGIAIFFITRTIKLLYGKQNYGLINITVFMFLTLPVFPSSIKRHYIHYQEAVLFLICCFTFLKYQRKPNFFYGLIATLSTIPLCYIYDSGLIYGLIVFSFIILSVLFTKKRFSTKFLEIIIYSFAFAACIYPQLLIKSQTGSGRFADKIELITSGNWSPLILLIKRKCHLFLHYLWHSAFMPLYFLTFIWFGISGIYSGLYKKISQAKGMFFFLQAATIAAIVGIILVANLGIDQVATPIFFPLVFLLTQFMYQLSQQKKKTLYRLNYNLVLFSGIVTTAFSFVPQTIESTENNPHHFFMTDKKCFHDFTYRPLTNKVNFSLYLTEFMDKNKTLTEKEKLTFWQPQNFSFLTYFYYYYHAKPVENKKDADMIFLMHSNKYERIKYYVTKDQKDIKIFEDEKTLQEIFGDFFYEDAELIKTHTPKIAFYIPFNPDIYLPPDQMWIILVKKESFK